MKKKSKALYITRLYRVTPEQDKYIKSKADKKKKISESSVVRNCIESFMF